MKKKLKIFILILFVLTGSIYFFAVSYSSEESACPYKGKINRCMDEKNKRTITDYLCIDGSWEEITYQIILDDEFTKVDNEIEEYLNNLEKDKDKYFGAEKEKTFIQAIDEITKELSLGGYYYGKYYDICKVSNIITKAQSCIGGSTNIDKALPFFNDSTCISLAKTKLYFYKQVAYNILMLNKGEVRKDSIKTYVQQERTKYDKLIDTMNYNVNLMNSISKKWPGKIERAYPN